MLFNVIGFCCCNCASDYRHLKALETNVDCVNKLAPSRFHTAWYHASVDVVGNHISGLLLVKNMPDSSYRVVFTNEAGVTFFDFGFLVDGTFKVHNVIKQLNKGPVIQTLQKDFELILGLPFRGKPFQAWTLNDEVYYGTRLKKETAYFISTKDCASLRRLELGSPRKRKVTVLFGDEGYPSPKKIELTHHTFSMQIKLTHFEKE